MLEAVNSVLQKAPMVRGTAEQVSSADSFAANPDRVQKIAQAPYISPYVHVDINHNTAVLALRDSETGDFLTTIPSETRLESRARDEARRADVEMARATASPATSEERSIQKPSAATAQAPQTSAGSASSAPTPQQIAAFQSAAGFGADVSEGSITVTV